MVNNQIASATRSCSMNLTPLAETHQTCQRLNFPPSHRVCELDGCALQAMHVSFGMAEQYKGICFLRFDDTNPEAEKQEYIDHIQDIVSWLGWKPFKVRELIFPSPERCEQLSQCI
jgi:hypothetical protein